MNTHLIVTLAAFLLVSCAPTQLGEDQRIASHTPTPPTDRVRLLEAVAIYSQAIQAHSYAKAASLLLIQETTGQAVYDSQLDYAWLHERLSSVEQDTWQDWLHIQGRESKLEMELYLDRQYHYLSEAQIKQINVTRLPFSDAIGTEYPGANELIILSEIGFNIAGNQALVIVSYLCGAECGRGELMLLLKINGEWRVEGIEVLWTQ